MNIFILKNFILLFFIFVFAYKFKAYVESTDGMLRKVLTPVMYVVFILGVIYDIFVNHLLTFSFMDFPVGMDETVTNRMKRYKDREDFKGKFARWLCPILNKYDPDHC